MTLMTRLSRLFRADMHAVLDGIEEPDALLREALREMEDALADERRQAGSAARELERVATHRNRLQTLHVRLVEELDVCLDADNHDLARGVLKRRLETERRLTALDQHADSLERALTALRSRIEAHEAECENLRQKAALFEAEEPTTGAGNPPWDAPWREDAPVRADEIEVALLGELRRRDVR